MEENVLHNVETDGKTGSVEEADIDFGSLSRLMYRYDTLDMAASQVRVDILNHFRMEDANKFSTGELVEATGRNDSNVSEALGQLVDDGHLEKIQKGFYALKE
jgi:Fic family protein